MAKKRAFVRYSKQGKIVPGSLILTAGSFPNGPSTWNEVPADLCCVTGTPPASCQLPDVEITADISSLVTGGQVGAIGFNFDCNFEGTGLFFFINVPIDPLTPTQILNQILLRWYWLGTWSVDGSEIKLVMSGCLETSICPNNDLRLNIYNFDPGAPQP